MKPENFNRYLKKNKVSEIKHEGFSIVIKFTNGKIIEITDTYDGLSTGFRRKPKKNASKQLLKDLNNLTDSYYSKYVEKYGDETTPLFNI